VVGRDAAAEGMAMSMDEQVYLHLCDAVFRKIQDAFDDVDPDVAEVTAAGDVVTIAFGDGSKCIVNTQRPVRQIWLAGGSRAWHFDYDMATGRWLADKPPHEELFATIGELVRAKGLEIPL
jgi:CyaY protein